MGDEDDDLDQYAQLDAEDTLDNGGVGDPLDEGYSPPERPWAVEDYGVTARESHHRENLDSRLARELSDTPSDDGDDNDEGDGLGDIVDTDGELRDSEVGDRRAGRLIDADRGGPVDRNRYLYATDAGIDGAAASAEEAAVHVIDAEG